MEPSPEEIAAGQALYTKRSWPEIDEANVLAPVTIDAEQFDSVGMNPLLHCVPGTRRAKAVVFENLKALANPGATVFGATLLHDGVRRNWMARRVMARNNRHRIFSNADDDRVGLEWARAAPHQHRGQRRRLCRALLGASSGTDQRR